MHTCKLPPFAFFVNCHNSTRIFCRLQIATFECFWTYPNIHQHNLLHRAISGSFDMTLSRSWLVLPSAFAICFRGPTALKCTPWLLLGQRWRKVKSYIGIHCAFKQAPYDAWCLQKPVACTFNQHDDMMTFSAADHSIVLQKRGVGITRHGEHSKLDEQDRTAFVWEQDSDGAWRPLHLSEWAVWLHGTRVPNHLLISLDEALDCEEAADSCQNALQSTGLVTLVLNFLWEFQPTCFRAH